MPHIIGEPCIKTKDTACVEVCPVDCIHPTKDEPDYETEDQLYIDPDTCIDCGLCVDECPVSAIYPEEDLPEPWSKYVEINLDYYKRPGRPPLLGPADGPPPEPGCPDPAAQTRPPEPDPRPPAKPIA